VNNGKPFRPIFAPAAPNQALGALHNVVPSSIHERKGSENLSKNPVDEDQGNINQKLNDIPLTAFPPIDLEAASLTDG